MTNVAGKRSNAMANSHVRIALFTAMVSGSKRREEELTTNSDDLLVFHRVHI